MALNDIALLVAAALGGGGLAATVGVLIKGPKEAGRIAVTAAGGAVIVQTSVIDTLRKENAAVLERYNTQSARIDALESRMQDYAETKARLADLEADKKRLREELTRARKRITTLEKQLRELGHPADEE